MYIITGLGRSGTTFIAEILKSCGHDMGPYYNELVHGGYEHPDATNLNKKILNGNFWGNASEIAEIHRIANSTDIVKDPRFIVTIGHWLRYKANIQGVFLCKRDVDQVLTSSINSNAGTMSIFNGFPIEDHRLIAETIMNGFINTCKVNHIDCFSINYPESIDDFNQVKCLSRIIGSEELLKEAWNKSRDSSKLKITSKSIYRTGNYSGNELSCYKKTERKVFDIISFKSYEDYNNYCSSDLFHSEISKRKVEADNSSETYNFDMPGFCWVCNSKSEFGVDSKYHKGTPEKIVINWKERLVCKSCGLNNRKRSSIHIFNDFFKPSLNSSIFLAEQMSPIYKWFRKKFKNTIGSEYLGESVNTGSLNKQGIRNEDLTNLTFNDKTFDYVIALDVFEHIPNYTEALNECRRVLRKDGYLFFTVPFFRDEQDNIVRAIIDKNNKIKHFLPPDFHGNPMSPNGSLCYTNFGWNLLSNLREVGFRDCKAHYYWSDYYGYLGDNLFVFTAKADKILPSIQKHTSIPLEKPSATKECVKPSSTARQSFGNSRAYEANQSSTDSFEYNHSDVIDTTPAPTTQCSIIIPVHNKLAYTKSCLDSLFKNQEKIEFETIVIDNASSDGTAAYLERLGDRVRIISNEHNAGFVDACNQGADCANGEYLIFLNNDTILPHHWIAPLLDAIESSPRVGAAGAKLVYPDGRLQEAGAVVYSDGTAMNFGRGGDPTAPTYNHICEVDYCSGACMLVRRDLFLSLGGFDARYAPAYYEETDFCFQLRAHGYRVLYVPQSEIIHHGSVTAGLDNTTGFRKYLTRNRAKFVRKWQTVLNKHESPLNTNERLYTADRRFFRLRKSKLLLSLSTETSGTPLDTGSREDLLNTLYSVIQNQIQKGLENDAFMGLRDLTNFAPEFALARNDMGVIHYRHGDHAEAAACYRSAVALDPQNVTFRKNLADLLWIKMNLTEEALKEYLAVLETDPKDLEALLALGHISLKSAQPQDAEYFFNRILEIDPSNEPAATALSQLSLGHLSRAKEPFNASSRRMIYVSPVLPRHDRESADYRNFQILDQLVQDGWEILYLFHSKTDNADRYMPTFGGQIVFRQLPWNTSLFQEHITYFKPDVLWITNLWTIPYAQFIESLMNEIGGQKAFKLILDTMDFHAKKFERKFASSNEPNDLQTSIQFMSIEKSIYSMADCVVTVTENEAEDIRNAIPDCAPIAVVPNIHTILDQPLSQEGRSHICFLGNFNVNHNIDAARYFTAEVFPLIRCEQPDIEFHIIGFGSERLSSLKDIEGVKLIGFADNLSATFSQYRVFACPLTYGAGMKGKIGMAMSNGLPIVSTTIGIEGFPVTDGCDCYIADDPKNFAEKCIKLLQDDNIWTNFQNAGVQIIKNHFCRNGLSTLLQQILSPFQAAKPAPDNKSSFSQFPQPQNWNWQNENQQDNCLNSLPIDTKCHFSSVVDPPRISIVIPTYNRSDYLKASLSSALKQSHPASEIIVIDDASTDDTANLVHSFSSDKIRYIRKEHSGAPQTRNRGIDEAHGEYIVWLDDDDILLPNAVETHVDILSSQSSVDVIYGKLQYFDDRTGNFLKCFDPIDWHANSSMLLSALVNGCGIPNPATLIKKKAYEKVGMYNESFLRAHDYEFWTRAASKLKFQKNNNVICHYRIHSNNMSIGGNTDLSYESLIIRNMVHRYGFKRLFHWLDWTSSSEADAVSKYYIAKSLYAIGDYFNCYNFLSQIPNELRSKEILNLVLHCSIFMGKSIYPESALLSNDCQFKNTLSKFKQLSKKLTKALNSRKADKCRQILINYQNSGLTPTAKLLLKVAILFSKNGAAAEARNILKRIQMLDPYFLRENKSFFNQFNSAEKEEIASTTKRILNAIRTPENGYQSKQLPTDKTEAGSDSSLQKATYYYQIENYQAALASLKKIITAEPNYWKAYSLLLDALLQAGQEQAIPNYFHPLENLPDIPADMLALLGSSYEASGDLAKAAALCNQAIAVDSACSRAWNLRGVIAYQEGQKTEAAQFFQKAIEHDDNWGDPWTNMGTLHWEHGSHDRAFQCFETGFRLSPISPNVATTYHLAASETEQYAKARKVFEDIVARYPDFRKSRFLLIDILLRLEDYQEALTQIESVLVRFGTDPQLLIAAKTVREKVGPMMISKKNKRPSLSLCMIVKNEERNLSRCLGSLKPLVDEIIVVDTGSMDATRDIAEIFGANVFDYQWHDDFADARNYSLEHASGDWVLVMDADEVIADKDHEKIRLLISSKSKSKKQAYMVVTRNYTHEYNSVGWEPNDGQYPLEEAGAGWISSEKVRLFPNMQSIRFEYPIHEVVGPSLDRNNIRIEFCPVPIHHYGKLDTQRERQKDEHYYKIGIDKLKSAPNDPVAIRELAVQAAKLKKFEDAIGFWSRLIEIQPNDADSYINMAYIYANLRKYSKAKSVAQKAIKLAPNLKEGHFNLGVSELHLNKSQKAESIFSKLTKIHKNYHSAIYMLGASQFCQGHSEKGTQTLGAFKEEQVWNGLHLAFQKLIESLMAAGCNDSALNLASGIESLGCSNEKIEAYRRQLVKKAA